METKEKDRRLDIFAPFGKKASTTKLGLAKLAIAYTRVSSKDQAENNMSLPFQREYIDKYAERNGVKIIAYFGGKYESATTDGRAEFQRMLAFIKQGKGAIGQIGLFCR